MDDPNKIAMIAELLDSASSSLSSARRLLSEVTGIRSVDSSKYIQKASELDSASSNGRIVEGVFDGQNMHDNAGNTYPVPANYASKSKLIPGDVLKLTITEEGRFIYKQIGPIERKPVIGPLTQDNGQYMVLANGKAYKVLLASVTYFKTSVGDEVTLIIPANEESEWGAIEAILPKSKDHQMDEDDLDALDEDEDEKGDDDEKEKKGDEDEDELGF